MTEEKLTHVQQNILNLLRDEPASYLHDNGGWLLRTAGGYCERIQRKTAERMIALGVIECVGWPTKLKPQGTLYRPVKKE